MSTDQSAPQPIHHHSMTVGFDGPDAADVFTQAARYCAGFPQPTRIRSVNIEYDEPAGAESICVLHVTYDYDRRR